jgi:hypothetical protein
VIVGAVMSAKLIEGRPQWQRELLEPLPHDSKLATLWPQWSRRKRHGARFETGSMPPDILESVKMWS